eukprot:6426663-Prymnesium_polylepis.1
MTHSNSPAGASHPAGTPTVTWALGLHFLQVRLTQPAALTAFACVLPGAGFEPMRCCCGEHSVEETRVVGLEVRVRVE